MRVSVIIVELIHAVELVKGVHSQHPSLVFASLLTSSPNGCCSSLVSYCQSCFYFDVLRTKHTRSFLLHINPREEFGGQVVRICLTLIDTFNHFSKCLTFYNLRLSVRSYAGMDGV